MKEILKKNKQSSVLLIWTELISSWTAWIERLLEIVVHANSEAVRYVKSKQCVSSSLYIIAKQCKQWLLISKQSSVHHIFPIGNYGILDECGDDLAARFRRKQPIYRPWFDPVIVTV